MELRLRGALSSDSLDAWIAHRARLLDLRGWIEGRSAEAANVIVAGPKEMIEAMEVCCSLGPADVLIDGVTRHDRALAAMPVGFTVP